MRIDQLIMKSGIALFVAGVMAATTASAGESWRMSQEIRILGAAELCASAENFREAVKFASHVVRHTKHQALANSFRREEIENGEAGYYIARSEVAIQDCRNRLDHLKLNRKF